MHTWIWDFLSCIKSCWFHKMRRVSNKCNSVVRKVVAASKSRGSVVVVVDNGWQMKNERKSQSRMIGSGAAVLWDPWLFQMLNLRKFSDFYMLVVELIRLILTPLESGIGFKMLNVAKGRMPKELFILISYYNSSIIELDQQFQRNEALENGQVIFDQ